MELRLVISGYYGFGNSGDEAVLQAILTALRSAAAEQGFTVNPVVLSINPEATERLHGVKAVHRLHLPNIIRALRQSDGLVSGGGSLLQDTTGKRTIPYYVGILKLAHWLGKPTFIYAQGIGPIRHQTYFNAMIKNVYRKSQYISVRDVESVKLLRRMGMRFVPVDVVSDPVMGLPVETPRAETNNPPVVAVAVRFWDEERKDLDRIAEALRLILERSRVRLRFLAFHPPKDRLASEYVMEKLGERHRDRLDLFECGDNPQVMLEQVRACDLLIGMRLHSLVYAAIYRIPMVGISYDPKIDYFLRRLDMQAAGTTSHLDAERVAEEALHLLANREQWAEEKHAHIEEMRQKARLPAQQICEYYRLMKRMGSR